MQNRRLDTLKKFVLLALLVTAAMYNCAAMEPAVMLRTVEAVKPPNEKKSLKTKTPASKISKSINVMTFNILWDKMTKGPTQWAFRKQGMVNLIKRHHPDIIGIQEGFINQMEYITSEVKYNYFGWGTDDGKSHLDNPGKRQSLNPIMYDQKRLSVIEKGVFWYADKPEEPGIFAGEDKHFRNCVWGKFKEKGRKGRTFYVFNTHFSLKDNMRQKQVIMLKSKIKEIASESAEVIVTGDFNSDVIRDKSYSMLIDTNAGLTLVDSKQICSNPASGPSFSGSGLMINSRTKGTEIDHIFVRNIKSSTAYKVIADYEGEVYPSDHFPVLTVLSFSEQAFTQSRTAPKISRQDTVIIQSRSEWKAQEARSFKQHVPIMITVHHEGGKVLTTADDAKQRLRNIQTWTMGPDRKWTDIPYHLLIAPDGTVYQGRNPLTVGETNTEYDPTGHLLICFLGNYNQQKLDDKLLKLLINLLADQCIKYGISPKDISTHRDHSKQTACPGEDIYSYFKSGYIVDEVRKKVKSY